MSLNVIILVLLAGAGLMAGPAIAWTRVQRTRQDLADAKAKLRSLKIRWWQDLGNLLAPVGLLVAVVLILTTAWIIHGGPK